MRAAVRPSAASGLIGALAATGARIHADAPVAGIVVGALAVAPDGGCHAYLFRPIDGCTPLAVVEALTVRAATGACSLVLLAPPGSDGTVLPTDTGEAEGIGLLVIVPGTPPRLVRPALRVAPRPVGAALLHRWLEGARDTTT